MQGTLAVSASATVMPYASNVESITNTSAVAYHRSRFSLDCPYERHLVLTPAAFASCSKASLYGPLPMT